MLFMQEGSQMRVGQIRLEEIRSSSVGKMDLDFDLEGRETIRKTQGSPICTESYRIEGTRNLTTNLEQTSMPLGSIGEVERGRTWKGHAENCILNMESAW